MKDERKKRKIKSKTSETGSSSELSNSSKLDFQFWFSSQAVSMIERNYHFANTLRRAVTGLLDRGSNHRTWPVSRAGRCALENKKIVAGVRSRALGGPENVIGSKNLCRETEYQKAMSFVMQISFELQNG